MYAVLGLCFFSRTCRGDCKLPGIVTHLALSGVVTYVLKPMTNQLKTSDAEGGLETVVTATLAAVLAVLSQGLQRSSLRTYVKRSSYCTRQDCLLTRL